MKRIIIKKHDFTKNFGYGVTNALVLFKNEDDAYVVTVDERVSSFYAHWAAQHEAYCCGDETECYGIQLPPKGDITRCQAVDKVLMSKMTESGKATYINKRIEMFETLLKLNLNPPMNDTFQASLDYFKSIQ